MRGQIPCHVFDLRICVLSPPALLLTPLLGIETEGWCASAEQILDPSGMVGVGPHSNGRGVSRGERRERNSGDKQFRKIPSEKIPSKNSSNPGPKNHLRCLFGSRSELRLTSDFRSPSVSPILKNRTLWRLSSDFRSSSGNIISERPKRETCPQNRTKPSGMRMRPVLIGR